MDTHPPLWMEKTRCHLPPGAIVAETLPASLMDKGIRPDVRDVTNAKTLVLMTVLLE